MDSQDISEEALDAFKKGDIKVEQKQNQHCFLELQNWLDDFTIPEINTIQSERQIYQLRDFIELSQGIKLRKKTQDNLFYLRCENFETCSYTLVFQQLPVNKKNLRQVVYILKHFESLHPTIQMNHECFISADQFQLNRRKKYLDLIKPLLTKYLTDSQNQAFRKTPNQILTLFSQTKFSNNNFLFQGLISSSRRQLKKKFDNVIANIKLEIHLLPQYNQSQQVHNKNHIKNNKKMKKKSKRTKNQSTAQDLQQKPKLELQRLEMKIYSSQNSQQDESLLKQIQMKEKPQINLDEKIKEDLYIYTTPTKKNKLQPFDLEKSSEKPSTQFVASYQGNLFSNSDQKKNKINHFSTGKSQQKNKKDMTKMFWQVQNQRKFFPQFPLSENEQSNEAFDYSQ